MRQFTLIVLALFLGLEANAQQYQFGQDGRDGRSGAPGASGRDGNDVTLFADGRPQDLRINGLDGSDARERGQNGEDAWSCMPNEMYPDYDLVGADGGNGGTGGMGGAGGRGGDLELYYLNSANLQKVRVTSLGGEGGRGTRGAFGGRGCRCRQYSWTTRRCWRGPEGREECTFRTHFCRDGQDGRSGRDGADGYRGRMGRLTLINSKDEIPPSVREINGQLVDLLNKDLVLAENVWAEREGALTLLAPGSQIENTYNEFVRRDTYSAKIEWASKRDFKEFLIEKANLTLKAGALTLNLPTKLWTVLKTDLDGKAYRFSILEVIKQAEVEAVSYSLEGTSSRTLVRIKNGATFPEYIENNVHAVIWKDEAFGDDRVFDKAVPGAQLVADGQDLLVKIGELQVKDSKTFKPGRKIKVKIDLKRSMGSRSTNLGSGEIKYKLPK